MVGLEHMNGARRPPAGDRVDEDEGFAAVEQVVRQVHAPDPVVHQLNTRTTEPLRDVTHHLGAEAVVAEEDIADPGYQNSRRDCISTLTSGGS
ncbi:hypothetical protein MAGR_66490 [Mycolicibacterium agri]|uniref:Uncharacterized protein n=1 Tax=Mycolicibacterium agri TaxID=36811 RepID=A0A7I9WD06_MYCAG|nr:hypothetical protein MAGR_66490 [Mycolicibacterium agri]